MNNKNNYQPPSIEIIQMENEGSVMGGSIPQMGGEDFVNNTRSSAGTRSTHQTSSAMQDLEDALNDLFTVGK